jgi:16S rRNA (adenine1518-N6/adenine1519-N6)-dimethyltransferase
MTPTEIKSICSQYNLTPSKSKGQNFLIEEDIVIQTVAGAKLTPADLVLEIGPGLGVLTEQLLKSAKKVIAVEVDKKAVAYLQVKFAPEIKNGRLELVEKDILNLNLEELGLKSFNYKIVANLPYNITSFFLRRFLENEPKPAEMVLMLQKEVAERILSKIGQMNILAFSAQFFSEPSILFEVPREYFWPEPKVDSAVICLKLKKKLPKVDQKSLFKLVKIGFSAKRKQLHNNLANGFKLENSKFKQIFKDFGWREDIRAQDLGVSDWIKLIRNV